MERIPCTRWQDCPVRECPTIDRHHLYYPAAEYEEPHERMFRNLGRNIIETCRREHIELHKREEPPEKPSDVHMVKAIVDDFYPDYKSVRKRKVIEGMLRRIGNA